MSKEIRQLIDEFDSEHIYMMSDRERLVNQILALFQSEREKLEGLYEAKKKFLARKTSHFKGDDDDLYRTAKELFWKEIFEILNTDVKPFDVRE